jgi:HlyD family secretion protein
MTSRKKRIIGGVAAALVLAGVVAGSVIHDRKSKVPVQTQKAERRDLVSKVSASGEVKPKRFVNISANVSGRIVLLLVKEGESVRRGQVLAKIDSARIEAGTRQSEAGLEAARAELDRADADLEAARLAFERTRRMHEQKLVSDQAMDQAQAELKVGMAMVEAQRRRILQQAAAVATDRDDLEKTTIVSPMDGVVTNLQKEEGEVVIGAQSFSPTVIMTVADLSIMEVEVMVDETDIRNVTLGQPAEVRVDALEGVEIKGTVTEIGSSAIPRGLGQGAATAAAASTGNQAKDFKVTVTLLAPPAALRPGLNATADITTAEKRNVLAAPIQAVVAREVNPAGSVIDPAGLQAAEGEPAPPRAKGEEKEGVFVVSKGQAQFKAVKTGIIGDTDIEIAEGLAPGDEIVVGSYKTLRTLKDKSKVNVEKPKEKP